jgi:hypothetical protein
MKLNFELYDNYMAAAKNLNLTVIKQLETYQIKEAAMRGFWSYLWLPTNKICAEIYNHTKVVNRRLVPNDEHSMDRLLYDIRYNFSDFHLEFSKKGEVSNNFNSHRFYGKTLTVQEIESDFLTMLSDKKWEEESIIAEKFDLLDLLEG